MKNVSANRDGMREGDLCVFYNEGPDLWAPGKPRQGAKLPLAPGGFV